MQLTRLSKIIAICAAAAAVMLGVTQASAMTATAGPAQHQAAQAAVKGPMSLKWIRDAVAEARADHASGTARPNLKIGNFSSCPALPSGDTADNFLCILIHITGGELQMGNSTQIITRDMTIPLADGTDAAGNSVLIPGTMTSEPMPVLGGIFLAPLANSVTQKDPNLQLHVKPELTGVAVDPTGATLGFLSQKIRAINPVFTNHCSIGTRGNPIVLDPTFGTTNPPPPATPISGSINSLEEIGNEIVIIGTVVDNAFAAPGAAGCGPQGSLDQPVDLVGGLPSPGGMNTAIFQVTVEAISYTNISS
jgi:hypothetical protein